MRLFVFVAVMSASLMLAGDGRIEVGDEQVRPAALQPYQATWKIVGKGDQAGQIQGLISETLSIREGEGQDVYHRLQVTSGADGVNTSLAEVTFSARHLEPLTSQMKRGGETAWDLRLSIEEGLTQVVGRARLKPGNPPQAIDRKAKAAAFDGAVLGLVLAALPLEEGFQTELPALWIASASEYTITARVAGRRSFPDGRGGQVEAWAVAVDWLDLDSGQTFNGGDDGTGGTYYVVPHPPEGFPHVPAYVNSSASIELVPGLL
ncbi:MAG TPA: hypothetical protein VLV83_21625 [Acidobacteriota bacterium]|nr:hypothetical protein [Acidobacteriota bacterium]